MLKGMRRHAKYFYVLFFVVILSFIFWGVGGVDDNGPAAKPLAEIGGEVVAVQDYWRAYENLSRLYRDVYGAQFDPEAMGLKKKILDGLVEEKLLLVAAREAGIRVSDKELEEAIVQTPAFQREGAFDKQIYENTLRLNRMAPSGYEAAKRDELMLARMRRLIEATVELTPSEVRGLEGTEELYTSLRETLLDAKREAAVKSFLEGVRKRVPVKVNEELIS